MENTKLKHVKNKKSVLKWFVLGLIPVVNLYVLYKVALLIAYHEENW